MDALERLKLLGEHMDLEPAEDADLRAIRAVAHAGACGGGSAGNKTHYIGHAVLPGGKQMSMLKTLLTSVCERNCYYCPFRTGRDTRRTTFKPDEMASAFLKLHRSGQAEGIFLSSGIAGGGIRTEDRLLDTAEILRRKLGYRGYLHLKIMPGAERAQVEQAMRLADRVSINLEAPNTERLRALAPHKTFTEELLQPLRWIQEIRRTMPGYLGWNGYWPSSTTQFVVGGVGESDLELLTVSENLYRQLKLKRVYYSAFTPIENTPLEDRPPTPAQREFRLYQASFLLRDYGFCAEEMPFDSAGQLPLNTDPKLAWAETNLSEQPIELNRASRQELLRVPGIGPKSAERILQYRREGQKLRLQELEDLKKIGANPHRAAPFILLDGKRPVYQLRLW